MSQNETTPCQQIDTQLAREGSPDVRKFADHSVDGRTWGYTYFVRRDNLIKIGHSGAPKARTKSYGPTATVLAIIPNTVIDESAAHKKFHHLRAVKEWFQAAPELLEFIEWAKGQVEPLPPPPLVIVRKRAPRKLAGGLKGQLETLLWAYENGDAGCKESVGFYMKKTLEAFNADNGVTNG